MSIIVPYHFTREYLVEHTELTFLFACSLARNDVAGHIILCHDLPNCYPIFTKRDWCNKKDSFWHDSMFAEVKPILDECFERVPKSLPIISFPNIGRGCSELRIKAPAILAYIDSNSERTVSKDMKRLTTDGRLI